MASTNEEGARVKIAITENQPPMGLPVERNDLIDKVGAVPPDMLETP